MHKGKYICFFFSAVCLATIKMERDNEFLVTQEEVNNKMEDLELSNETSREMNSVFEDEDERNVKVFIFEGAEFRSAISNKEKLWENGTIPYEISDDYDDDNRKFILEAMEDFRNNTCVRFQPRKNETSYILIMPGTGCSAVVGRVETSNKVSLSENCFVKGIVLHELMHALGFIHEQNRPDRDEFVRIVLENVKEGSEVNFDKRSPDDAQTFNQTYDFGSVMHYGEFDFSKNSSIPTIIPRQEGVKIGQREGFSEKDLIKINLLYNCDDRNNDGNSTRENPDTNETSEKHDGDKKNEKIRRNRLLSLFSKFFSRL